MLRERACVRKGGVSPQTGLSALEGQGTWREDSHIPLAAWGMFYFSSLPAHQVQVFTMSDLDAARTC